MYGADVSTYQAGFNFTDNARECPFVIIKQTEGLTWPDQDDAEATRVLREMRDAAQHAGYKAVGLYHFARPQPTRTGAQEADHLINFIHDLREHEFVCLDYEENRNLNAEQLEDFAISFVDRIEERWPATRGKVLFYSFPSFLNGMSTDRIVTRCPLWIAAFGPNDGKEHPDAIKLDRWSKYTFWQFSSAGRLTGWGGDLDVNRFDGSEDDLRALTAGTFTGPVRPEPAPQPPVTQQPEFDPEDWHGEYLRRGSEGVRVVQIQQRLKARGWRIDVDGHFGRATDTVVRKFQREKGLNPDGVIGQETWDAMYAYFEGVDVMPPPVVQPPPPPPAPDGGSGEQHADPAGQCAAWGFDGNAGLNPVREFQRAFAWWPIGVDGVAGPETAKAVQHVVNNGDRLSAHFSIAELACKHCGRIRFLRQTLECAERARQRTGPINVVSGYRCPVHNANVGGATSSQHMVGAALDLKIPVSVAEGAGFTGIGTCGSDCLHGDDRANSGNNTSGASPGNPTYWRYC